MEGTSAGADAEKPRNAPKVDVFIHRGISRRIMLAKADRDQGPRHRIVRPEKILRLRVRDTKRDLTQDASSEELRQCYYCAITIEVDAVIFAYRPKQINCRGYSLKGCMPIDGNDLPDHCHDRKDEAYKWVLHHTKRFKMAHGIILNSFIDLERGPIQYLQEEKPGNKPKVYPDGPLTLVDKLSNKTDDDESQSLKWLDEQPLLESMVCGIPLIAWPLYAEQRSNAVMLTEDIKVALSLKIYDNDIIGRLEIAEVVKELMEGEEGKRVRIRKRELKDAARKTLKEDGSSTKALDEIAWRLKNVSCD
ncbi:hypothetical protein CQW23_23777 [Capsicum baccatum]|uniref:Hydroquinone glucosyltransferase n=1 Tax=Capsicum baccatum TaxID=33114 RepID=A0A2G2VSX0_CAPBA|nr:hypothetical protein CQW23_23777 [Capsicum baccatum]